MCTSHAQFLTDQDEFGSQMSAAHRSLMSRVLEWKNVVEIYRDLVNE